MNQTAKSRFELVQIHLPVLWVFLALVAGLFAGLVAGPAGLGEAIEQVTQPIGAIWLRALQMTIIPLVGALLVLGIAQLAGAARAGRVALNMLALVFGVLAFSGLVGILVMPLVLDAFPVPPGAAGFLADVPDAKPVLPGIGDFFQSLVAPNIIAAAAETAMLPLTVFFALLGLAITRLPDEQSRRLLGFFHALANAMLVMIGWVLWVAPLGVFALAFSVALRSGGGAFAALGHYILTVASMGAIVLVAAYALGWLGGRIPLARFARALLPSQAVALSTQSSLASLPAMLDSAERLKLRDSTSEFALPLAVAIFRATSPAMNLAVALYVARLAGIEPDAGLLFAGLAVALIISIGSVSLPGSISFVISIGPVAIAMGVPIEPLALLVAVEMMPDIMRTVGNVTMNVALTATLDRLRGN